MGRGNFEQDWKEVLGWGDDDLEPASVMLRLTHPDGEDSLLVKDVFIAAAPDEGDYLCGYDEMCQAKIVAVHEVHGGLVISAESQFDGTETELIYRAIGRGWEFLSIDHETN